MDTWFADWNNEVEVEIPMPGDHKKPLGVSDGLVELLWENGEVILQSQTHHKPTNDTTKSKKLDQSTSRAIDNSTNSIRDYDETVSWSRCAIDHESFEKQFFANFSNHVEANKLSAQFEDADFFEFSASDDNQFFPSSQHPDFDPIPLPPPRFETFDSAQKHQKVDKNYCARKVATQSESNEQIITSCGGSDSSLLKTRMHYNDTNRWKRKRRDVEECECQSDATQLESSGHKSSLKSGTSRRSRVPQVHNLSERKRRDRINEKMRALQELIPHSNKFLTVSPFSQSGKASVLDEAIQYMKSLQLQLQKWNATVLHVPFRTWYRATNAFVVSKLDVPVQVAAS
ncbi:hypothetical protein DH2020_022724 [Rehmannia glutinosa]|uniref:BHLH domain-containing protein n=1 Tax=Rehmannia glutinosa TaxID=99300 RepID=A0ABR0W6M2_REHGL